MKLHENKEAFSNAIRAASDYLGIRTVFVRTFAIYRTRDRDFNPLVFYL